MYVSITTVFAYISFQMCPNEPWYASLCAGPPAPWPTKKPSAFWLFRQRVGQLPFSRKNSSHIAHREFPYVLEYVWKDDLRNFADHYGPSAYPPFENFQPQLSEKSVKYILKKYQHLIM